MKPMQAMQAISTDDQNVVDFSESPGRRLRVLRQSRGLEIERIAAQLHLRVDLVEALEQDRYQDMAGPVFVAGYLNNYARLLGIDPEPLVAAFRAANPDPEPAELHIKARPRQEIGSGHILVRLISIALAVAVITLIVLWWQSRAEMLTTLPPSEPVNSTVAMTGNRPAPGRSAGPASTETAASSSGALPMPTAAASPPNAQADQQSDLSLAATTTTTVAQTNALTASPAHSAPTAAETTAKVPEVSLTFTGPTSIKVRDASGTMILNRKLRRGESRVLTGTPPYSFAIGNAAAVRLSVDGRPISLTGRTQGKAARFTLDPRNPE